MPTSQPPKLKLPLTLKLVTHNYAQLWHDPVVQLSVYAAAVLALGFAVFITLGSSSYVEWVDIRTINK